MSIAGQNFRNTVLLGNLNPEVSESSLREIFAGLGTIVNFRYFYDKESGKPNGYGICEFRESESALTAVRRLNGFDVKGKLLRVDISTSEKSREELKNLQMASGGSSGESTRDNEAEPEKAPEAISKAVASLPPEQMFELMKQMKMCVQNNPNEARNLLLQNPQLAFALLQAQVVMRIVDPQVVMNVLNRPVPNTAASSSSPLTSESEPVKTTTPSSTVGAKVSTTTASVPVFSTSSITSSKADVLSSSIVTNATSSTAVTSSPSVTSLPPPNVPVSESDRNSTLPPRSSQLDMPGPPLLPEVLRPSVPTSRHHPQRGQDTFAPFGDPRSSVDPRPVVDPRTGLDPRAAVDPRTGLDPRTGVDPRAVVDPRTGLDPRAVIDPRTGGDPRAVIDPRTGGDPRAAVDPRTMSDRDMRIPPRNDLGNMRLPSRIDQDMRNPSAISLGDQDMRQPMGDQDFRMMRGPQMMESHSYDPRLRSMTGGDASGRPSSISAPYDQHQRGPHPFDPRTVHDVRLSVPQPRLEDPRTAALAAMRTQAGPRTGSSTTSALAQSLSSVGSSRPPPSSVIAAANAIAPHDQEKAALIMQVLQLSDEQIAMLPIGQRQSILILKEQIARSCPT